MRICVIDGQGGGLGRSLIEKLRSVLPKDIHITALGTNSAATLAMIKAGATDGATGENAIIYNVEDTDVITGPIGIIAANSMLGELTPVMANAISKSKAYKILVPINKCNVLITGTVDIPLPELIDRTVKAIIAFIKKEEWSDRNN